MGASVERLKIKISRYMSYLLRHNPGDLKLDEEGYVSLGDLVAKLRRRYLQVDERLVREIVEKSDRRRFEIKDGKIRALYGHSIPVKINLSEDREVEVLYHGTTREAISRILKEGLRPMRRRWVHLSPTIEIARRVALRRTSRPVILKINANMARVRGIRFYKATEEVYLCKTIPPECIEVLKFK